ncbi:MAG: gliding motility-associated C-terminal domain-containing protein, partial [Saprospiraceae bacterium]
DVACYQYLFVDMLEIMPAEGSILGEDIAICDGSDFVVEEPIVDAFEWNTGQTEGDFIISDPGTYWLNYTLGSCVLSDTIEVLLANFDDFTLGPDSVICAGEGLILGTDFVADSYVWQDGSTDDEFLVTTSGIYELTITLSENCVISDEVMVDVEPVPFLELGEDILACLGDSVFLNVGLEDATYEWNDGSDEATILVTEEGTYSVVLDLNGCSTVDEVTIQFRDFPLTFLPSDSIICMNDTLILNVSSPASTYEWSTGSIDPSILVSEGGLIEVEVSNPCGTILQSININEVECDCEIFIPTAFSRNEDGLNENFKVYTECTFESFHLRIFNRMGQILFESFHSDDVWSGMYKNEIQPVGMYNYILDYQELDHENTERILGHVVLIR